MGDSSEPIHDPVLAADRSPAPPPEDQQTMHVHKIQPVHGWKEFLGEILIIVIGVLIALGAEQVVEDLHWHEKVASAKKSIEFEINDQLDYAEEVTSFGSCTGPFVDALEAAILRHDRVAIAKLHNTRPPFQAHPWRSTAWQSALSTQVASHLDQEKLDQHALIFTSFNDIARHQDGLINDFAEATAGRIGGPTDMASTHLQLIAAERLRSQLAVVTGIARATSHEIADGRSVSGWKPIERHRWQRLKNRTANRRQMCLATVQAANAAPANGS